MSETTPGAPTSIAAELYMAMMQKAVEAGTAKGVERGIAAYHEKMSRASKERLDRRLRNTKILLSNYRGFKAHVENAIADAKELKLQASSRSAIEILADLDDDELHEHVYVDAIRQSQQRTITILAHIDSILRVYRAMAQTTTDDNLAERCDIIHERYIYIPERTMQEIASQHFIDLSSAYRMTDRAIEELTTMIFGIDALTF